MFPLLLYSHVMLLKKVKLPMFGMPWRSCGVRVVYRYWIWFKIVYEYTCIYFIVISVKLSLFFSVIILCVSVDTIYSAYWLKLRVLFVQLKMLWSQTQDNGHAGLIHLARLKCSQLCWCSSRWIFWSCSSQWNTRDQTHWHRTADIKTISTWCSHLR